ncbi:MYB DNA-binding domain protein [Diplocarpon rosae]|nr:MYB DNA-binding domain protein [Diplocarpon rosae]
MPRLAARASASRGEASSPPKTRQSQRPEGRGTRATRSRSHSIDPGEGQAAMSNKPKRKREVRQSSVDSMESAIGASTTTRGTRSRKATKAAALTRDLSVVIEDGGEAEESNDYVHEAGIENIENTHQHQSPGGMSQMSSVTATTSFSHGEMETMDPFIMAESLPDLFESSKDILDLLAPSAEADEEQVGKIIRELRIPGSHYALHLKRREKQLKEVKGNYGDQTFIQTSHVLRRLLGSENAGEGDFRPDHVIHAANLAALVTDVLVMERESQGTHIALRCLCQNFPGAFMNSADDDVEAQSKTVDLAFDLALKLHIQHAIAYLRGLHEKGYHLTPDQALADLFYEDIPDELDLHASYKMITQDSTMKNIIGGLGPLTQDQVGQVEDDLDNLAMAFRAEKYSPGADDLVDFEHLDGTFSWNSFLTQLVQWVRLRFNEAVKMIENQGGIDNVAQSLTDLMNSNDSQGFAHLQPPLPISQQRGLFSGPDMKKSNASLYGGPGTVAFFESLKRKPGDVSSSRPQARSRHSSSAPVPVVVNAKKGSKSTQVAADSFQPTMHDANEDHINDHPRPTAEYTAAWDQNSKEKDKENHRPIAKPVAKRRLIDPQPNAERISNDWDISQEDLVEPSVPKRGRARAEREESEESEGQGFQEDQRLPDPNRRLSAPPARRFLHAENDRSPPKKPRVTCREASPPVEFKGVVARRQEREEAGSARSEIQDDDNDDDDDDVPPPTATELSAAARSAVARSAGPRVYRGRIPWSDDDSARLEEGIEEYGCSWALIHNSRRWDVDRGQVALKDRARNLKVQYLKNRMVLPRGFDRVALGKKEKDQVRKVIPDYDE